MQFVSQGRLNRLAAIPEPMESHAHRIARFPAAIGNRVVRHSQIEPVQQPPPQLVFGFLEDGTLRVFPSATAAASEFDGIDIESSVVRFYDSSGVFLEPRFVSPDRRRGVWGIFNRSRRAYELVPGPSSNEDSFALALYETAVLEPNEWFANLTALKQWLRGYGVRVDDE